MLQYTIGVTAQELAISAMVKCLNGKFYLAPPKEGSRRAYQLPHTPLQWT